MLVEKSTIAIVVLDLFIGEMRVRNNTYNKFNIQKVANPFDLGLGF